MAVSAGFPQWLMLMTAAWQAARCHQTIALFVFLFKRADIKQKSKPRCSLHISPTVPPQRSDHHLGAIFTHRRHQSVNLNTQSNTVRHQRRTAALCSWTSPQPKVNVLDISLSWTQQLSGTTSITSLSVSNVPEGMSVPKKAGFQVCQRNKPTTWTQTWTSPVAHPVRWWRSSVLLDKYSEVKINPLLTKGFLHKEQDGKFSSRSPDWHNRDRQQLTNRCFGLWEETMQTSPPESAPSNCVTISD